MKKKNYPPTTLRKKKFTCWKSIFKFTDNDFYLFFNRRLTNNSAQVSLQSRDSLYRGVKTKTAVLKLNFTILLVTMRILRKTEREGREREREGCYMVLRFYFSLNLSSTQSTRQLDLQLNYRHTYWLPYTAHYPWTVDLKRCLYMFIQKKMHLLSTTPERRLNRRNGMYYKYKN